MNTYQLSGGEMARLNTATRSVITATGGLDAAASVVRVARSQLSRYQSPHDPLMMPIDVVAALERASGQHAVTDALAQLSGHVLVPRHSEPGGPELLRQLGQLLTATGEACVEGGAAMADNVLTESEVAALTDRLHAIVSRASATMAWLAQPGRTVRPA